MIRMFILAAVGMLGLLAVQPAPAEAQGLSTCARVLWKYVGKPLSAAALDVAGGIVVDYFADKLRNNADPVITENDIQALSHEAQRSGVSECELRRELEGMYASNYGYTAEAYCSMTGVVGRSRPQRTPNQALTMAVNDCIYRGGVPSCCQRGAYLTR